jgi:hypothetical protein
MAANTCRCPDAVRDKYDLYPISPTRAETAGVWRDEMDEVAGTADSDGK